MKFNVTPHQVIITFILPEGLAGETEYLGFVPVQLEMEKVFSQ